MNIADLIDPDDPHGRTYREIYSARSHLIPIGSLVEFKTDTWYGDGACALTHARLWVVAHTRDCDGEPLYSVSRWRDPVIAMQEPFVGQALHGLGEEQLTVIPMTDELRQGVGSLSWEDR